MIEDMTPSEATKSIDEFKKWLRNTQTLEQQKELFPEIYRTTS